MPDGDGPTPAVVVRSLTKTLGLRRPLRVLDEVDLVVRPGQVLGLAGPNGAGKSTLLKVLLGLVRPSAGAGFIFGHPVGPGAGVLGRVGAMVDGPGFLPYLSGRNNLELIQRTNRQTISPADLQAALEASGLGSALDRPYRSYSHGMRYRLGLASAMIGHPELLLLDEPTTGLDPSHVAEVVSAIKGEAAAGATILLTSHDLGFLEEVCSHAAFLIAGRIDTSAPVPELVDRYGSIRAAYLQSISQPATQESSVRRS